MQTRKQFLKKISAVTAGATLMGWKEMENFITLPKKKTVYFDLHCHAGWAFINGNFDIDTAGTTVVKTVSEMAEGHLTGGLFALVADAPLLKLGATGVRVEGKYAAGDGWVEYKRQLNQFKEVFNKVSITLSTQLSDLNPKNRTTVGYIAVEGGDFLEGQIEKVEEAYRDGVQSIQLVHYSPNGLGDLQTAENTFNGLSPFGKEVVKKMNELGMGIDVAHASFQTVKDVASLTYAPIILSHSILEMETDRPMAKRAISKDHAKLVAETGGLIGAWPSGFNKSFEEYVDNIKRLIDIAGIDHVGLGTDMNGNFKPVLTSYTQFPGLAEALQGKGLSQTEVGKVMGENARAVFAKIFKR